MFVCVCLPVCVYIYSGMINMVTYGYVCFCILLLMGKSLQNA